MLPPAVAVVLVQAMVCGELTCGRNRIDSGSSPNSDRLGCDDAGVLASGWGRSGPDRGGPSVVVVAFSSVS